MTSVTYFLNNPANNSLNSAHPPASSCLEKRKRMRDPIEVKKIMQLRSDSTIYCLRSRKIKKSFSSNTSLKTDCVGNKKAKIAKSDSEIYTNTPSEIAPKMNSNTVQETSSKMNLNTISEKPSKIKSKTISERIKKNCDYAIAQQEKEESKKLTLGGTDLKHTIKVGVGYDYRFSDGLTKRKIDTRNLELNAKKIGITSCQGRRVAMEDSELVEHQTFKVKDIELPFEVYGVFDGHSGNWGGGIEASTYVKSNITSYLKKSLEFHNLESLTIDGIFHALKECCQKLDADYPSFGGTTVIMAMVLQGNVWIANVGDSRAIFVKNGKAVQASEDAKPEIDRYKKTIEKLGGELGIEDRVNGILATARAIGDKEILGKDEKTCCVSPNPKISCYSLEDFKDGYLVLACDGLYDVATTNEVGRFITAIEEALGGKLGENEVVEIMSNRLVYDAIRVGSEDNVTVMVIKLR